MIYVLLLLLGVTAVWGWTFVVVKDAIAQYPTVRSWASDSPSRSW